MLFIRSCSKCGSCSWRTCGTCARGYCGNCSRKANGGRNKCPACGSEKAKL